jgi:hypothetical protein
MRWGIGGTVLLAAVALAACSGKPDGCVPLGDDVAQAIVNGATGDLRLRPATGQAIRSDAGVYFAAYRINAAGTDEVGVWALSSIDPPGAIRSVDGYAQQFTSWPVLENGNGSNLASDAEACLD